MSEEAGSVDFHKTLDGLGAANYSPHRFNFSMDVNPLVKALSPKARLFFYLATEDMATHGQVSLDGLYARPWHEDPELIARFWALSSAEQVEVLTLHTVPLHEALHHIDFMATPFGARFYVLLVQEYLAFQDCSPFLLQNQDVISPGAVGELADRLARVNAKVPEEWRSAWEVFRATTENLIATVDSRGLEPDRARARATEFVTVDAAGTTFEPVSVFGRALSYRVARRPGWYLRASTLLEGRALIHSLLWIIDSIGVETPGLAGVLRSYLRKNYGAGTAYDYLFLLDLAAAWVGDADFDSMLRRPTITVRNLLHLIDNAAWFGLNGGMHLKDSGFIHPENVFTRFLFGLEALEDMFRDGSRSPYQVLSAAECSEVAKEIGLLPTPAAIESALTALQRAQEELQRIWQPDMAQHFDAVLSTLSRTLTRRQPAGLAFSAGAHLNGNALYALDVDTFSDLFEMYTPSKWVNEWFDFRNRCMFSPALAATTLTYLREQFGLAELAIWCDCGTMLSKPVPKWRPTTIVSCPSCKKQHRIDEDNVRYIYVDEDLEN
jgi:hypothetical protein